MPNLLQRAFAALRSLPPPEPVTWETVFGSRSHSLSGIGVTSESALDYSPVWSGVSTLSRDVAKLPLILYKNLDNGGKEPFRDHSLYRVLKDEANPEMTSYKFRETMQALCLLYGNAYAEIVRDAAGRVSGLYPIIPTRVVPERDKQTGRLRYRVTQPSGGQVFMPPENLLHLSSLSLDGILGRSIVEHAQESLGLGLAAEKFGAAFFGNGATFGGVAEYPGALSKETREEIRHAIEAIHAGVERAHRVLVLAGGAKFTPRGTAPNEAQFVETRKFQINEVARWLTMPPHKLGDLENAHFTNIEEQEIQYYVGCVSGWLKMWEQELSRKLIRPLEYRQQTIEHNLEGVLRGDSTKRADFYTKMFQIGAFSINRILQLENQNPIGPAGDVHMVPLNMMPIERLNEYIDAQVKPEPAQLPEAKTDDPPAEKTDERMLGEVNEIRTEVRTLAERLSSLYAEDVRAAEQAAEALRVETREAQAVMEAAKAEAREATARETAAQEALADATVRLEAALGGEATAVADAAAKQAQIDAALADVAEKSTALSAAHAQAQALTAKASEAQTLAQDAEAVAQRQAAEAEELRASLAQATAERDALEARATAADAERVAAVEQAEQERQERLTAERARMARVVTAHRTLILETLQRIARTETTRARKSSLSPDKLRRWMDAFYNEDGQTIAAEMLFPAVQTHLAWKGSDEDPRVVARALVREYYEQSVTQLRPLVDGLSGDEFRDAFDRLLERWEHERPAAVADKVVQDEIEHLSSLR